MKNPYYEWHGQSMKRQPFVFHTDRVTVNYPAAPNFHDNVEFLFVVQGEGKAICDSKCFPVKKGNLICVNSHVVHSVKTDDTIIYDCLIVDRDFCRDNGIDTSKIFFKEVIVDAQIEVFFSKLHLLIQSGSPFSYTAICGSLLTFIAYLAENHQESGENRPHIAFFPQDVLDAVNYMKQHLSSEVTLDTLSRRCGLSRYHFAHKFKSVIGYSPLVYLNMLRIEKACRMLAESQLSIADVAAKCGFNSPSYFAHTFQSSVGILPSDYRKEQKHK